MSGIAEVLSRGYGLRGATVTPIPSGAVNQNSRIDCPGRSYVLKRYAPGLYSDEQIRDACVAQMRVRAAGVPAPAIEPALNGDILYVEGTETYVLHRFVPGRQHRRGEVPSPAARAMGETLGHIHQALMGFKPVQPYTVEAPAQAMAQLETVLRLAEQRRHESPVDEIACQVLRYKLDTLPRFAHLYDRFAAMAPQWMHGDYQETNVLFTPDNQVAAVIDFDNSRCRPRAYEVMRAFALSFPAGAEEAYDLFAGYAAVVRPPAAEVELYAPFRTYYALCGYWPIGARYLQPELYQERWDRFIQPPSDWWPQNVNGVTERLLKAL